MQKVKDAPRKMTVKDLAAQLSERRKKLAAEKAVSTVGKMIAVDECCTDVIGRIILLIKKQFLSLKFA